MLFNGLALLCLVPLIIGYYLVALAVYAPFWLLARNRRRVALFLFGRDLVDGSDSGCPGPPWLESALGWILRLISLPLAGGLWLLIQFTCFTKQRRDLLPFLASRCVLSGSGLLHEADAFYVANKALCINCLSGFNRFWGDRPIFSFGHFFKDVSFRVWFDTHLLRMLFTRRHRLQICLGDANLCEVAEYLRIGTTLLVLDAIEAGEMPPVPRLRRPIQAMAAFAKDPSLSATAECREGPVTALELQRFYFHACRHYLARRPDAPPEARELLQLWGATLDALETDPQQLMGSLDWVTKRFLLEHAGEGLSWEARKKIDLRYHELSGDGYFQQLERTGTLVRITDDAEVEQATRFPPADSPAATRGRYIREFSRGPDAIRVNWEKVVIGRGWRAKVVRLAAFRRQPRRPSPVEEAGSSADW